MQKEIISIVSASNPLSIEFDRRKSMSELSTEIEKLFGVNFSWSKIETFPEYCLIYKPQKFGIS